MRSLTIRFGVDDTWKYLAAIVAAVVVLSLIVTPLVFAEGETPDPNVTQEPAPQPTVVLEPTVAPPAPAPTSVPVVVEPPVTEPPAAPVVPVQPEPTAPPVTPANPEPATVEPTIAPTVEPSPTPEPTPVITWSQSEPVKCVLRDGQPAGLKYAETRTYRCEVSANVSSDLAMPNDMEIEWTLDVNFPDSYQLRFPQGSQASIKERIATSATATTYTIAQPWQAGSEQKLAFELDLTRTTCAVGEQVLGIQASPTIRTTASEAEITRQNGNIHPQPARIVSPVISSSAPVVGFDGPISFESLGATSSGLESNVSRGSATIVVTGEWDPCTTWTVNLSGTVSVPAETPAMFRTVSVNNEFISGDACDLSVPCDVIVLPPSGTAATPLRYTIGLELHLHELTPVGNFGITVHSDIRGEVTRP